jgi:transcriptional regulator with XRE-family HTH domain
VSENGSSVSAVGPRIRKARERRGLSVEELAARLGVSDDTLRRWESGHAPVRLSGLLTIAGALSVTVEALMPEVDVELLATLRQRFAVIGLTPQQRGAVEGLCAELIETACRPYSWQRCAPKPRTSPERAS